MAEVKRPSFEQISRSPDTVSIVADRPGGTVVTVTPGRTISGGVSSTVRGSSESLRQARETARKVETQRQDKEIGQTVAETSNIRRELAQETKRKLMDRSLGRQERLKIKQEFQRQSAGLESQKASVIKRIKSGESISDVSVDIRKPYIKEVKRDIMIGEVQVAPKRTVIQEIKSTPGVLIERVTGRKPREVLRFFTGREKDVTEPVTFKEVITDIPQIPIKAITQIAGPLAGEAAFKTTSIFFEDVDVKREVKEVPRGTVIGGGPGMPSPPSFKTVEITIRSAPKRAKTIASLGTQVGLFTVAPTSLIAPGFVAGGVETATDTTLSKPQRVLGVVEAEAGLLLGGIKAFQSTKGMKPLKVEAPPAPTLSPMGKRGMATVGGKKSKIAEQELIKFKKEQMTRLQATTEFGKKFRSEQLKILRENVFKNRVYLDEKSLLRDVKLAEKFMRDSGLTNAQITDRIHTIFPQLRPQIIESVGISKVKDLTPQTTVFGKPSKFAGKGQFEKTELTSLGRLRGIRTSPLPKSRVGISLEVSQASRLTPKLLSGLAVSQVSKSAQRQDSKQDQFLKSTTATDQLIRQEVTTTTGQTVTTTTTQVPRLDQPQIQVPRIGGGNGVPGKPIKEITKIPPSIIKPSSGFSPISKPTKKRVAESKQGYHPEIKEKGKWKRVVQKPRTRKEALALAGYIVDNSTAVQLRLIKARKNAIREKVNRRINRDKFRDFGIFAGKKRPLPNQGLIEKKGNRIDTRGEKQQLSAAKLIKSKQFKSISKPRKKAQSKRKTNFLFGGGFGGKSQRLI